MRTMRWISSLMVGLGVTVAAQSVRAGLIDRSPGACQPVKAEPLPAACQPVHVYLPPPKACEAVKACEPVHPRLSLERVGYHVDHGVYTAFHKVREGWYGGYGKGQVVAGTAPQAAPLAPSPSAAARLPEPPAPSKP